MPDAHLDYGLPIGGVLATDGAVGVDIAYRMKMTVLDVCLKDLEPPTREILESRRERDTIWASEQISKKTISPGFFDRDWLVSVSLRRVRTKPDRSSGRAGVGIILLGLASLN